MKKHPLGREGGGGGSQKRIRQISRQPFLHKSLITEQPKKNKSTYEDNVIKKLRQEKLREIAVSQPGFLKPR